MIILQKCFQSFIFFSWKIILFFVFVTQILGWPFGEKKSDVANPDADDIQVKNWIQTLFNSHAGGWSL